MADKINSQRVDEVKFMAHLHTHGIIFLFSMNALLPEGAEQNAASYMKIPHAAL